MDFLELGLISTRCALPSRLPRRRAVLLASIATIVAVGVALGVAVAAAYVWATLIGSPSLQQAPSQHHLLLPSLDNSLHDSHFMLIQKGLRVRSFVLGEPEWCGRAHLPVVHNIGVRQEYKQRNTEAATSMH